MSTNNMPQAKRSPLIQPYLFFDGRCEEAVEFYQRALGAERGMLMRFKDRPEPPPPGACPPGCEDKVMHASFRIGETLVMAADGHCEGKPGFQGFSLALTVASEAEADRFLTRWRMADKCGCPWPGPFFPRALAWSPTVLACPG